MRIRLKVCLGVCVCVYRHILPWKYYPLLFLGQKSLELPGFNRDALGTILSPWQLCDWRSRFPASQRWSPAPIIHIMDLHQILIEKNSQALKKSVWHLIPNEIKITDSAKHTKTLSQDVIKHMYVYALLNLTVYHDKNERSRDPKNILHELSPWIPIQVCFLNFRISLPISFEKLLPQRLLVITFLSGNFFLFWVFKWWCFLSINHAVITSQKHLGPYGYIRYPLVGFILMQFFF